MSVNIPNDRTPVSLFRDAQHIEELAWWDIYNAAPEDYAHRHQLRAERLSGGTCFAHKHFPSWLFNRVLKFGTSTPATQAQLDDIQSWISRYANPSHTIGIDPNAEPAQVKNWLSAAGLGVAGGGLARFLHTGAVLPNPVDSELSVREVGASERKAVGGLVRAAFGFPEGCDDWFGQLAGRPGWRVYFACDGETPVGVGALYVNDGLAWLGVGATLKEHRGRGAQSLLIDRRVRDALAMGVTGVHVETGHPLPGDAIGPSYRNILRAGFEVLFVREHYMPKPAQ